MTPGHYRLGPPREACSIGLPGANTFWNNYPEWLPTPSPMTDTRIPCSNQLSSSPLPAVHLNGTGRANLLRYYTLALATARQAKDALAGIDFHGRDYYTHPIGMPAYYEALEVRRQHLSNLDQLIDYLRTHIAAISKAPQ